MTVAILNPRARDVVLAEQQDLASAQRVEGSHTPPSQLASSTADGSPSPPSSPPPLGAERRQ
jgi:hypothetical protein